MKAINLIMKEKTKEKAITLIGLAITVVILLILASVTINLTLGESGIFVTAKRAVQTMDEATFREKVTTMALEYQMGVALRKDKEQSIRELEENVGKYDYKYSYMNNEKLMKVSYEKYNRIINLENGISYEYIEVQWSDITDKRLYLNDNERNTIKLDIGVEIKNIKFKDSAQNIVEIDENMILHAINIGDCEAIVEVEIYGQKVEKTFKIKVENLVEGITLDKTKIDDFVVSNNQVVNKVEDVIIATVDNQTATNKNITWKSSNNEVATVDENGNVTAVGGGSCIVSAVAEDESGIIASCDIVVKERKYMYYYGNEFEEITGGWEGFDPRIENGDKCKYRSELFSKEEEYLKIGYANGVYWQCGVKTKNKLNTEKYDNLVLEIYRYLHEERWQGNGFRYGISENMEGGEIRYVYAGGSNISYDEKSTITIDISDKHDLNIYTFISHYNAHTGIPYGGYNLESYIYLYNAYFEK